MVALLRMDRRTITMRTHCTPRPTLRLLVPREAEAIGEELIGGEVVSAVILLRIEEAIVGLASKAPLGTLHLRRRRHHRLHLLLRLLLEATASLRTKMKRGNQALRMRMRVVVEKTSMSLMLVKMLP